jgi:hypothetical protein
MEGNDEGTEITTRRDRDACSSGRHRGTAGRREETNQLRRKEANEEEGTLNEEKEISQEGSGQDGGARA